MALKLPTTTPNPSEYADTFRYSPLEQVRLLFVGFYQGLFAASPPGMYHWSPEEELNEIYISDEAPAKETFIGKRPAITFTRGSVSFQGLGLDDMLEFDPRTGAKTKSVLIPGIMTINASSRVVLESERLAFVCAEMLWLHRELMMKAGFFEIGRQLQVSAPSPAGSIIQADGADEWFTTSVPVPFQFYRTSRVTPLGAKIVNDLAVRMNTRAVDVQQQYNRNGEGHCGPINNTSGAPEYGVHGCLPGSFAPSASDARGGTPFAGADAQLLPIQPHPLNPSQMVVVRGVRPNCPAVRPAGMGGRAIPIPSPTVEESCGAQTNDHIDLRTVKV